MIRRGVFLSILFSCFIAALNTRALGEPAVTAATPEPKQKFDPPVRVPADLIQFFSGEWTGTGEFASGKKIEADVSFALDLNGQWLVYRHADLAPNTYQALGLWGYEATSKAFVMMLSDSFGGARLFTSSGWHDGKIVFVKYGAISPKPAADLAPPSSQERFTFERQADDAFKMTYEASKDGTSWRMGDYLDFKKRK